MSANPYPGLRPFRPDESHLFFGRDGQADAILARLKARHFVAVMGVSGCGKSSLLNAGVFPGLHAGLLGTMHREWRIARLQPRNQPLRELALALARARGVVDRGDETAALSENILRHSSLGLVNLVRGRLASEEATFITTEMDWSSSVRSIDHYPSVWWGPPVTEGLPLLETWPLVGRSSNPSADLVYPFALLLVVDQFEEIFRFWKTSPSEDGAHFVQLLIEAVRQGSAGLPIYVALAMRSDFQGQCAVFPGLPELINGAQYLVPRLNLRQREAAIVRPAATEGKVIARPLLNRLLDDMGVNPDQLPVLQHALQRTWEEWWKLTRGEREITLGNR